MIITDDLDDPRLDWLARCLIFVERPGLLCEQYRRTTAAEKAERLLAADCEAGGWTTLSKAVSESEGLLQEGGSGIDALQSVGRLSERQTSGSGQSAQ